VLLPREREVAAPPTPKGRRLRAFPGPDPLVQAGTQG
jgi:hypothetical protein